MPDPLLRSLTRQLLDGVSFMHSHRIAHRDLKPTNLLVNIMGKNQDDYEVELRIADLGMGRATNGGTAGNFTTTCTTIGYRPPELLLGAMIYEPTAVDMWSVGCILAEMVDLHPFLTPESHSEFVCLMAIFRLLGTPDEV